MSLRRPTRTREQSSGDSDSEARSNNVDVRRSIVRERVDSGIRFAALSFVDYSLILSSVLGGCCTNVWAYEELLKMNPGIGSALTFSQMLFITLHALPRFVSWNPFRGSIIPQLKARQVPLYRWALQVLVLTSGSLLNNWVFAFDVPLTVQIIFRSAGLAVSMLFGYFFLGKRYTALQIASVIMVTAGVVLATLSRPTHASRTYSPDSSKYMIGISMLTFSLILTGILGLMQEQTYRRYGPCWREGVFYTHFLSLPVFLFLIPDIKFGLGSLSGSLDSLSRSHWIMGSNLVSQMICVSGVNRLSSQVSSVSTNLVLTVRKAISLCFSIWWFGNGWNNQLSLGALMVFSGSLLFTL